ncbi:MAG: YdcF family protein [Clostridia bacterium]|nr:YdcF family protein [Clostridia bacterium]
MKSAVKQIAVLTAILFVFCLACRFIGAGNSYRAYLPMNVPGEGAERELRPMVDDPHVLGYSNLEVHPAYVRMDIKPGEAGKSFVDFYDENGDALAVASFRVGRLGTVYDEVTGGFTGDWAVLIAVSLFYLTISAIMLHSFVKTRGSEFYSYISIYFAGFSLFSLVTGITMTYVTVRHFADPVGFTMLSAYETLLNSSLNFMVIFMPLVVVFALALAYSNIVLLRHERRSLSNLMGLTLSFLLLAGEALGVYLFTRNLSGSEKEVHTIMWLQNVYAAIYVYFLCMLWGAAISALRAASFAPAKPVDFIIILGCRFRKDGSLPPLLKGRVDKALSFAAAQREDGMPGPRFVPSGGQGADESMSEAEAMSRYLAANGVAKESILPEDKSENTYQNMLNSRQLILDTKPDARVAFSTTRYHVFRSGILANRAGLNAEGMGSPTRWWYWPNAFVREWLGLMLYRWKQEALLLVMVMGFFRLLARLLG